MVNYPQKIFTIHFHEKKVYIENTCKSLYDKMEDIKNDKDHKLYSLLKEYPNPEIRVECYKDKICTKKSLALKYRKDNYKILNVNVYLIIIKPIYKMDNLLKEFENMGCKVEVGCQEKRRKKTIFDSIKKLKESGDDDKISVTMLIYAC